MTETGIAPTARSLHITTLVVGFILARQSFVLQTPWNWIGVFIAGAIIGAGSMVVFTPIAKRSPVKWVLAIVVPGIVATLTYNLLP